MSSKIFTEKEIEKLSQNKHVKNVTSKSITYTDEFKRIFITENEKGKLPRAIFKEHGFDITVWGKSVSILQPKDGAVHIRKMASTD